MEQLREKFESLYGKGGNIKTFFAPGRVNLIGEHIDYNGGFVFPAALTLGITAMWRKRDDMKIVMKSLQAESTIEVEINSAIEYDRTDEWGNFPKGVFNFLKQEGYFLIPGDILFSSNLPDGAGLSSSAAIEVVTAFMMLSLAGEKHIDLTWLSTFTQSVENKYIGVNCGIMDQFTVANGKKDHAILLDCQSLEFKHVPFVLEGFSLVVMNTNKRRELADSKYNERRAECDKILEILNKKNDYANLCEARLDQVERLVEDEILKKRAKHVITENERVLKSVDILEKGDVSSFSKLLNDSHQSLKVDYEVTGIELDTIVSLAQNFEGCEGARMTGAGFGGCAIAIVKNEVIDEFKTFVGNEYFKSVNLKAEFYVSEIGDGVHILHVEEKTVV